MTELASTSNHEPRNRGLIKIGKGIAGLLATALLTSGCTVDGLGGKYGDRGLPDEISMEGPQSPTDKLAQQLQLSRMLHGLVADDYVMPSEAERLSGVLKEESDTTVKMILGHQIMKSIAANPVSTTAEVDQLMEGASAQDVSKAQKVFRDAVYDDALQHISYGQSEPEAMGDAVGNTDVKPTVGFLEAAFLEDADDALSSVYDVGTARRAIEDVAASNDPEVKQLAQDYLDYETANDVCDRYSYGGIYKEDAERLLDGIQNSKLVAIVKSYITAEDSDDYVERRAVESKLYDFRSDLEKRRLDLSHRVDSVREKAVPSMYDVREKLGDEEYEVIKAYDESLEQQVVESNANLKPKKLGTLQELENGYGVLDFTNTGSDKILKVFGETKQDDATYQQIAEAYVENSKQSLHFEESAHLDENTAVELEKIYKDVSPLIEAAMQQGAIYNVRFVVDATRDIVLDFDYSAHYDPLEKSVYVIFPRNKSVSFDLLRQTLIHEVTHALIEEAYSGIDVSKQEVNRMKAACKALSDEARGQFMDAMNVSINTLDNLVQKSALTPMEQRVFSRVKKYIQEGTLNKHSGSIANLFNDFSFGCEAPSMYNILQNAIDEVSESEVSDVSSAEEDEDVTVHGLDTKLKGDQDYTKFLTTWYDAIRKRSLYAQFNEASRVESESEVTEYVGHSEDVSQSGTELPASLMSGLLGDTETMRQLYEKSASKEKGVIRLSVEAVTSIIIARYPTLSASIKHAKKSVLGQ